MAMLFYPEFEVVRNEYRCIACRVCERQCANEVHAFDSESGLMVSNESSCVNCQRCVSLCPTRALKIVKMDCTIPAVCFCHPWATRLLSLFIGIRF